VRVAILHDWLVVYGGAERVLEQMLQLFPQADVFSVVEFLPDHMRHFLQDKQVRTTFIQHLPLAKSKYRSYLPLMPLAVEQLDLSGYDLILSNCYAVIKGVITGPDQLHLCMCHSPMRYAWDLQFQYLQESGLERGMKGWLARYLLHRIRRWDARTANGVDGFMANSNFIARRIMKVYRRESTVVYPPVDVERFTMREEKEDFYLAASRMVPYKKIDLIVEAFSGMPDKKLVVIGDGPDFEKVKSKAGANVTLLGYQSADVMVDYMQRAKAFVFAAEEDFGIVPVEAQACGTPVIAFGKGGALETIRGLPSSAMEAGGSDLEKPTGVFFYEQTTEAIREAVELFEKNRARIRPEDCRENSLQFSTAEFRRRFMTYVNEQWELHQQRRLVARGS
jgi:glycosyltransferase involved in cell wall biosynthesis